MPPGELQTFWLVFPSKPLHPPGKRPPFHPQIVPLPFVNLFALSTPCSRRGNARPTVWQLPAAAAVSGPCPPGILRGNALLFSFPTPVFCGLYHFSSRNPSNVPVKSYFFQREMANCHPVPPSGFKKPHSANTLSKARRINSSKISRFLPLKSACISFLRPFSPSKFDSPVDFFVYKWTFCWYDMII